MITAKAFYGFVLLPATALNTLQGLFALATRLWLAWQFLKSGWLKITSWENTLFLFQEEYRVPLLPSNLAAVLGTAGELVFPVLLGLGLAGRLSATGLFFVNVLAVISYSHVLLSEGFEAALAQHVLWGFMALMLAVYGPGKLSADYLLERFVGPAGEPAPMTHRAARAY